jgi:hypothetical protein
MVDKAAKQTCSSCGVVHPKRTKAQIAELSDAILDRLGDEHPMTVRQTFYALLGKPTIVDDWREHRRTTLICKDERDYKGTVMRLMGAMREDGVLPWEWVADESRWMRKPKSYLDLNSALIELQSRFRADRWCEQDSRVEIWCEKNALSGIIFPITSQYDVPFMVGAGFSSKTFLHDAAMEAVEAGKPTVIGYIGDHDPSGKHIIKRLERDLRRYVNRKVKITVQKLAVTPELIEKYALPTRPTKTKGNAHAKNWKGGRSVEVDALPMDALRILVNDFIVGHINAKESRIHSWHAADERQGATREAIGEIISYMESGLFGERFVPKEI